MKLESQVVSLELAKQLKEMGVKQESYFYWYERKDYPSMVMDPIFVLAMRNVGLEFVKGPSAFTVAELGEALPVGFFTGKALLPSPGEMWFCTKNGECLLYADTEADARAKMRIHLIKKGIVKP